ncbi:hypothetical protein HMPREF9094_1247 [Fusobacterium animalis ATCC 51191]|uniref:Conjugal transfer protein TrbL n=1 Tax=Fusobacterium animalis ATCC 51191 TaxID=997347 RepID=F9EMU2_9FUSO|nr:hypothetical protein HMPREF9094_1247 [Fusobacterium animalis ATCC 51191]
MEESGDMVFTEILDNFIKILENVPGNLKGMCMTLLYFLSTIDIALTVYKNIDNPDFNYIKWAKMKILNVGFIILAIKSYEWLLNMVKDFFLSIGTKGLGLSLNTNNYFNDPSAIWDKGREIGGLIIDQLSWRPATYIFILLGLLTYIGFFLLAMRIIICWVEYYFLTGFSIVFLPCGVLDLGTEFYKNVFKTIMSCSIKLGVFNMWLLICDKLMKSIMTVEKKYDLDAALVVCGTVYVLVAIMLSMPSITTGLLTGSPAVNAGAAMAAATAGAANTYRGAKEIVKGAIKGAKTGAKGGATGGAFLGSIAGPGGVAVGKVIGGTLGAVGGAAVGGSYSGARYAAFKEKGKNKKNNGDTDNSSKSNSSSNSFNGVNTSQSGNSGVGSSRSTANQQSTTSNSSGNNGGTPSGSGQASSSNIQGTTGSVNTSAQTQVNASNSSGDTTVQPSSNNNATTADNSNMDSTQATGTAQSSTTNTDTSTATNVSNSTSSDSGNNVDNSNSTNSSINTSSTTSSDTGSNSEKSGIKVNGGEAGKLPDWMQGDY